VSAGTLAADEKNTMTSRTASLTELANRYGSDKGTEGPSRHWHAHNYTDIYEAYLGGLRNAGLNLLEVGLGIPGDAWDAQVAHGRNALGGASMRMWYDYFPQASIFGADIHDASFLDNDRVRTFRVDQGERDELVAMAEQVPGGFDVVIDDGSHRPDHQQITFGALFPYLKPGGVYFIEDLMRNGKGDSDKGRFSAPDVLNTRRVFRRFQHEGSFPTPHAIGPDADALGEQIDSLGFHVPRIQVFTELRIDVRGRRAEPLTDPMTVYKAGTEAMVAIRKKR
jgi:hypothetical protein